MDRHLALDAVTGLGEHEVKTILDYKKKHPSMGPAQIRAPLERFLEGHDGEVGQRAMWNIT